MNIRRVWLSIWMMISIAAIGQVMPARADELRPLPVLDQDFTSCLRHSPGVVRSMGLTVRLSTRNDVGPYSVELQGYARLNTQPATDSYTPFLIAACRGDKLRIDMRDELAGQNAEPINLHTHGMIVRPTPNVPGPPGDYIFMEIDVGQHVGYRIDIPQTLPGNLFGRYPTQQPYPTGLFWFHSHMHGMAADDVTAGQAGVLSVGNPLAIEHSNPDGSIVAQTFPPNTDVKYLAIRDIQLGVPNCPANASDCQPGQAMLPDKVTHPPYAHGVTWIKGEAYDSGLCSDKGVVSGPGFCGVTDPAKGTKVWLFTVNGQRFPQITMSPGRNQLWRIANLSASTTYVLELKDDVTGELQPVHVMNIDGVLAGTPVPNDPHDLAGVHLRRLLLMPASRAEIFISGEDFAAARNGTSQNLTFQSSGIMTGAAGVGDPWPPVALARLHVEAKRPGALVTQPLALSVAQVSPALSPPPKPPAGEKSPPPQGCVLLPSGDRRVITFAQDNASNTFMLGSEVVTADGTPIPGTKIAPVPFPQMAAGMGMNWDKMIAALPGGMHVCPVLGGIEVWELVNTTDELHNFHIHQTRFRLARRHDPGVPRDFVLAQTRDCGTASETAVCDPGNIVGAVMPEFDSAVPVGNATVWHDTIAVPPRMLDAATKQYINGHVFVAIPFTAPEQVGRFVFHCHILEHEDGGMMAPVEVVP